MKQTISINISGQFFHIDEDAYNSLSAYLESLKHHFRNELGKEEIIQDIENRIAEILQSKIGGVRQVVEMKDVEDVIAILGRPEDFVDDGTATDKTDSKFAKQYKHRRLFRDPDNRVLGGVASGIAHYFEIDPIWIRLAFIFSFFFSGPLIYLVAWIIIPMARTTSDKLEMRGERVNISQIEQNIKEELNYIKEKMHHFKDEAKGYYDDTKNTITASSTRGRFFDFMDNIFKYTFKAFLVFVGVVLFVVGSILVLALITFIVNGFHSFIISGDEIKYVSLNQLLFVLMPDNENMFLSILGLILLIGVPVAMVIVTGLKLILGIPKRMRLLSFTATLLWLVGFMICFIMVMSGIKQFKEKTFVRESISSQKAYPMYVLSAVALPDVEVSRKFEVKNEDFHLIYDSQKELIYTYPTVEFMVAPGDKAEVAITKRSNGETKANAAQLASQINCKVQFKDSLMMLNEVFSSALPWRNQKAHISFYLPLGKKIYIDDSMKPLLYTEDKDGVSYREMKVPAWYVMTDNGLKLME